MNNMPSRPQSSNAAFGLHKTYRMTECLADVFGEDPFEEFCTKVRRKAAVSAFTDDQTWYPGIEVRGDAGEEVFYFRDIDASVVLPNWENETYSTRVVDEHGNPLPEWYGDTQLDAVLGTGEPTLAYGVALQVESAGEKNRYATVMVTPAVRGTR